MDTGTLETHPFRQDRFVAVLPSGHPLGERDGVLFADVLDYDLVGLDRASAITRFLADKAMRTGGRSCGCGSSCAASMRCAGWWNAAVGLGIVPETTARRAARSMGLDIVPLLDPWAARDLTICLRSLEALPVFAREFVAHLRAGASRPGLGLPSGAGLG